MCHVIVINIIDTNHVVDEPGQKAIARLRRLFSKEKGEGSSVFKIGITNDPIKRRRGHTFLTVDDQSQPWRRMYVLFESIDRKKVEDMEKTLIGLFSLRGDNKEPPKETYGLVCWNQLPGGDGPKNVALGKHGTHYVYVLFG